MSPTHLSIDPRPEPRRQGRRRTAILVCAALICCALGAIIALSDRGASKGPEHSDLDHLVVVLAWAAIGVAYLFVGFRPRRAGDTDASIRARADALQAKRARMLMLNAGFVGLFLTPMAILESINLKSGAGLTDRLFDAVFFLGPFGVTVALITGFTFSRSVGAAVEDELTAANRAAALRLGFAVTLALGAAGYVVGLLRPEWALAALPAALGAGVTATGLRFAWLEMRLASAPDETLDG